MLKYLVILLDDTSSSFCHYENEKSCKSLIPLDVLKSGIVFGMKENLMIQFVYPDYELPEEYKDVIHSIDHTKIASSRCEDKTLKAEADVLVFHSWAEFVDCESYTEKCCVVRTCKQDLFDNHLLLKDVLSHLSRINVVITDVETFTDNDFEKYKQVLNVLSDDLQKIYVNGMVVQLNVLTDRMMLTSMNNCNAGWENITLAPDGKFYVCPAFYQSDSKTSIEDKAPSIGDLQNGLDIKNPQLYKLSHAPLCRNCDAYQCKRCVWLNRKTTLEVNIPSREQCVMAHVERNVSRDLLESIRKYGTFMPEVEIKEISYLDPFDVRKEW